MPIDRETTREWFICESGDRWLRTVRRFGPAMMPPPLVPVCLPSPVGKVPHVLRPGCRAVVLWEVDRQALAIACDRIAETATRTPDVLQLVAGAELSNAEKLAVLEFPCATVIRHPEELPGLTTLIRAYFSATPRGQRRSATSKLTPLPSQ